MLLCWQDEPAQLRDLHLHLRPFVSPMATPIGGAFIGHAAWPAFCIIHMLKIMLAMGT